MDTTLLVDNLPAELDDAALATLFTAHGTVLRAAVTRDPTSGASTGAGEVEMATAEQAAAARDALAAKRLGPVTLRARPVPAAKPKLKLEAVAGPDRW